VAFYYNYVTALLILTNLNGHTPRYLETNNNNDY
jgi:hypothetical protein